MAKSKLLSSVFLASFSLMSAAVLWAYIATKDIQGPIIVHFNTVAGITQTGTFLDMLLIGIVGMVMVIANFVLALEIESRDPFLGKIIAAATLFLSVLIFISFAAIISVN